MGEYFESFKRGYLLISIFINICIIVATLVAFGTGKTCGDEGSEVFDWARLLLTSQTFRWLAYIMIFCHYIGTMSSKSGKITPNYVLFLGSMFLEVWNVVVIVICQIKLATHAGEQC
jgi:hypothetical protein